MIRKALQDGDLKGLFIEHLGWDHSHGEEILTVNGEQLTVRRIAHKRGLQVFAHQASRVLTQVRQYVKAVEEKIEPIAHEHILVVHDAEHSVQVWAWAYQDRNSGRWRQRFHPFFTTDIPDELIQRLKQLAFSLEEEDSLSLLDVAQRVEEALVASSDQQVFFRRPGYASTSHELAMRMQPGCIEELQDFVAFHRRLPEWFAKRYRAHAAAPEDVAQIAAVGMIRAAYLFDPTRGAAFSTYSFKAMQTACNRGISAYTRVAPIPEYLYWRYRRVCRWRLVRFAEAGPEGVADGLPDILQREGIEHDAVCAFDRFSSTTSFSRMSSQQMAETVGPLSYTRHCNGTAIERSPLGDLLRKEAKEMLEAGIDTLSPIGQEIIRARFGIGRRPETLEEIAVRLSFTKERTRQREATALRSLRYRIAAYFSETQWQLDVPVRNNIDVAISKAIEHSSGHL